MLERCSEVEYLGWGSSYCHDGEDDFEVSCLGNCEM